MSGYRRGAEAVRPVRVTRVEQAALMLADNCPDNLQPVFQGRARAGGKGGFKHAANAVAPFSRCLGLGAGQIVQANPGMRIQNRKRGWFAAQGINQCRQQGMFHDIGKITGVVAVSVIQCGPAPDTGLLLWNPHWMALFSIRGK